MEGVHVQTGGGILTNSAAQPALEITRIVLFAAEAALAQHVREFLSNSTYRITTVGSTATLDAALADEAVDLVLLDADIPGNEEALTKASASHQRFGVPALFLGSPNASLLQPSEQFQPCQIVLKPLTAQGLKDAVDRVISADTLRRQIQVQEIWTTAILRALGEALIVVDPHGRITFCSAVAEHMLGVANGEVTGKKVRDVLKLHDAEHAASSISPFELAPENPQHRLFLAILKRLDRSESRVLVSHSPVYVNDGKNLQGSVLLLRDVSDCAKTEQAISDNNLLSARSRESLQALASGSVPDQNEPLSAVSLYRTLLARKVCTSSVEAQRQDLEQVVDTCRRTSELLISIWDSQRGRAAKATSNGYDT